MTKRGASPASIEEVYRERSRGFLLAVTAMLRDGDAALDVVQDGFAQALARRRTFRREGSLEGWIWRIVLNVARDRLRARRGGLAREPAAPEELHVGPDLRKRLLALPERQRLAIFLHYYADMSYEQIAEALGVTTGTVAASLSAARSALREALERELVG